MERRTKKHRPAPNANDAPVSFVHMRYPTDDGQGYDNMGGATIAYRDQGGEDVHGNPAPDTHVEAAWARCAQVDNYNKKIGRAIAVGNLDFGRCWLIPKGATKAETREAVISFFQRKLEELQKKADTE